MSIGSSDLKMPQKVTGLHFLTGADLDVNASDGSGGVKPSSQPGFTPDTLEEAEARADAAEVEAAALRAEAKAVARKQPAEVEAVALRAERKAAARERAAGTAPADLGGDDEGPSRDDLMALAKEHQIKSRSSMGVADLTKALTEAGVEF